MLKLEKKHKIRNFSSLLLPYRCYPSKHEKKKKKVIKCINHNASKRILKYTPRKKEMAIKLIIIYSPA